MSRGIESFAEIVSYLRNAGEFLCFEPRPGVDGVAANVLIGYAAQRRRVDPPAVDVGLARETRASHFRAPVSSTRRLNRQHGQRIG
jgi:hypothetical protein